MDKVFDVDVKKKKKNILNFSDEYINSLSKKERMQLPFVVYGSLIFMAAFIIMGAFLFFQSFHWNAILPLAIMSLITSFWFLSSFILITKKKLKTGAYLSTIGILFAVIIILIFTPASENSLVYYRSGCFFTVMAVCNLIVTIERKQIWIFSGFGAVVWIVSIVIYYQTSSVNDFAGTVSAVAINSIGVFIAVFCIAMFNKLNSNLVSSIEKAEIKTKENLNAITKVLEESKAGLDVGQKLYEESEKVNVNIKNLNQLYGEISENASRLSDNTVSISKSSSQVKNQSEQMINSVTNQNTSINETSNSLHTISENLSNLSGIAEQRSANMNEMIKTLDAQKQLIKTIVDQVQQVQESSNGISGFVNTVNSIAEHTGLLAMNASIEAAHAGENGKGFSVIAQEIRKLSEQTKKNAAQISEELDKNNQIVSNTTQAVASFEKYIQNTAEEMSSTIEMVDQILTGIQKIDEDTGSVMKSLKYVVDESQATGNIVDNVVNEIGTQNETLSDMTKLATELHKSVEGMSSQIQSIQDALDVIENEAKQNIEVTKKVNSSLA